MPADTTPSPAPARPPSWLRPALVVAVLVAAIVVVGLWWSVRSSSSDLASVGSDRSTTTNDAGDRGPATTVRVTTDPAPGSADGSTSTPDGTDQVEAPALELGAGRWSWLGGVTPDRATIVVAGLDPERTATLWFRVAGGTEPARAITVDPDGYGLGRFELTGLSPATAYEYGTGQVAAGDELAAGEEVSLGGDLGQPTATFRTFADGPRDLVIAFGSCAELGSNHPVFRTIADLRPDLFLSLGDLHYADLESDDPADHLAAYDQSLSQPNQAALFGSIPTAYVWDDHDFGGDNSDRSSPARLAVSEAYRRAVPNYGVDPDPDQPINQAFTVGRVRIVMTDGRSQRHGDTVLGDEQRAWLLDELISSSATHRLVIWANPTPWIGEYEEGSDRWFGYPEERATIAQALADAGVHNLVMISGDAHMVALDDGTNTAYDRDGLADFPLLHGAALDRDGSVKGGPYSHGTFPGPGQFGVVEVDDDGGSTIEVRLSGQDWEGDELVSWSFELEGPPGNG